MKKLLCSLLITLSVSFSAFAQHTEVWIIRHAEKDRADLKEKNPDLSEEGKIRATDLVNHLKKIKFDAAYSTPFKRTYQTIDSLVKRDGLTIIEYNPKENKKLVEEIKKNYSGKKIIIVGHSNTVLEIIEAFGGKRPKEVLTEDDYDYIFRLSVKKDQASVKTGEYGRPHRM